jgi:4-diphosphocytidyl-2-C-methyl-D-erythritol kinase
MDRRLEVAAPAKINLHLRVVGRRRDGYHELRTLYQSIDLADRLTVEEAPPGELALAVTPAGVVSAGDDNLVLRAARLVAAEVRDAPGARFELRKRIPVSAGLGGGSADAAAALVLANRLWAAGLDSGRLHDLAAELGSDVPFFLHGGLVFGVGRGDELVELPDLDRLAVVVVAPGVRVATSEVFERVGLTSHRQEGTVDALAAGLRGRPDWQELTNELEAAVVGGWPGVGEALRFLRSTGPLHAALSGSGAASYAVFDDLNRARQAVAEVPSGWFVHVGVTLPRRSARLTVSISDGGW